MIHAAVDESNESDYIRYIYEEAAVTLSQAKTATLTRPAEMPLLRHPRWRIGPR